MHKIELAQPNKYYALKGIYDKPYFEQVQAWTIHLPEYPEMDFFYYSIPSGSNTDIREYYLCEGKSGLSIHRDCFYTLSDLLNYWQRDITGANINLQERIKEKVDKYGLSPRYKFTEVENA